MPYNVRCIKAGGGFETSGMMSIKHSKLLGSIENHYKNVISATCNEVKKYDEEFF